MWRDDTTARRAACLALGLLLALTLWPAATAAASDCRFCAHASLRVDPTLDRLPETLAELPDVRPVEPRIDLDSVRFGPVSWSILGVRVELVRRLGPVEEVQLFWKVHPLEKRTTLGVVSRF